MKIPHPTPSKAAFTLIELLVVISIIAILASLAIPATTSAMVSAKKAQARNDMAQIANAVKLYYTEYGRYPVDSTSVNSDTAAVFGASTSNSEIVNVLRYVSTATDEQKSLNPRQIKFIEPKVTTSNKGCVNRNDGRWYDPWGAQYVIFIDADYDGEIAPGGAFNGGIDLNSDSKVPVSVGVASVGYYTVKYRGQSGTLPRVYNKNTDLLSWQ